MKAYYNEIDRHAAAWLRELITDGLIAPGDVDERSIEDVSPDDLVGYTQCHFFAGAGGWSYALRLAGWPDDRPVWTGSCPCQPFSTAGKRTGLDDIRHLWPAFFWLICQRRPLVVFGEQVAAALHHAWFDHVAVDLESQGYTVGAVSAPACGFGAPHIRQRLYWVAVAEHAVRRAEHTQDEKAHRRDGLGRSCNAGIIGDSGGQECKMRLRGRQDSERSNQLGHVGCPGPTNGFWDDAEWIPCRDGKSRPVEPGAFPLVDGASAGVVRCGDQGAPTDWVDPQNTAEARVMRLRGYGNAIVAPQAAAFIRAFMESSSRIC